MLRFTIRDVMWLTTVAVLLVVIATGYINRCRMELDMDRFKTHYVSNRDRTETARLAAYRQEIQKLSGKRVTMESYAVDPTNVRNLICRLTFDEPSHDATN